MELRPGRYLEASFDAVRDLVREDLAVLKERRAQIPAVTRFRDSHHRLARLFASGMTIPQVHERCGYSLARVSTLHADPAFQELIAEYRKDVTKNWVDGIDEYYGLSVSNMIEAELQVEQHLAKARDENEPLPLKHLLAISRDAADRFGYGKKSSKEVNLNVDFADRLQKAIQRSGKVIEHVPASSRHMGDRRPVPPQVEGGPRLLRRA